MRFRVGSLTLHRNGATGIVVEMTTGKWPITINLDNIQINVTSSGFVHEPSPPGKKQKISQNDVIQIYGFRE